MTRLTVQQAKSGTITRKSLTGNSLGETISRYQAYLKGEMSFKQLRAAAAESNQAIKRPKKAG